MQDANYRKFINDFGFALILISLTFIFYGFILQITESKKVLDPVKDSNPINDDNVTVHIDKPNIKEKGNELNPKIDNIGLSDNNIEKENIKYRDFIQKKFDIKILYGKETDGYSVGGFSTHIISDQYLIYQSLVKLEKCLEKYPESLFREIKDGGIPLTIILLDHYDDLNITGVADSSYSYAKISLSISHPFEESFYHESYHYIERYLFKLGVNFNSWNSFNPMQFEYGKIYGDYSYNNTFLDSSPFVNNYAQTMDTEDRASTFEYMMAEEKANCFNNNQIVWKKASLIARTIEYNLNSVSPNVTEYWERFL